MTTANATDPMDFMQRPAEASPRLTWGPTATVQLQRAFTPYANGTIRLGGGGGTLTMLSSSAALAASVTIGNAGTVNLNALNTYSGVTTINAGAVLVANNLAVETAAGGDASSGRVQQRGLEPRVGRRYAALLGRRTSGAPTAC